MKNKDIFALFARSSHLCFMQYCWQSMEKFIIGFHTQKICARIDKALNDYREGKSTYLSIAIHPRAGKSQIVSRFLPPHFIGEFPENNVMMCTYSSEIIYGFSKDAMNIVESDKFRNIYPNVEIVKKLVTEWKVKHKNAENTNNVYACSLNSGMNGRGAHLALLDDYCKGRESAESLTIRNSSWNSFTNDFMTRLAPVHIVIILATWWNLDDIRGRIKKQMEVDPNFPNFEFMDFPARAEDYKGDGQYPGKYIFSERFPDTWYNSMYSLLGPYSSASLMDCNPVIRGGNILDTTKIVIHKDLSSFPKNIRYARVWDLGHNLKKKGNRDPDPTGGTLLGFKKIGFNDELKMPLVSLWVKHYIEFTKGTTDRDKIIRDLIITDGFGVDLVFESTSDSVDTVNQAKTKLSGIKIVNIINVTQPKHVRISPLEGVFAIGNVNILEGDWNKRWIQGIEQFDGSGNTHDEMIDNMASGYEHLVWNGKIPKGVRW